MKKFTKEDLDKTVKQLDDFKKLISGEKMPEPFRNIDTNPKTMPIPVDMFNLEALKITLSKKGYVQICKCGAVFTLLLTGTGLSNWKTVNEIMQDVLAVVGDQYPDIEAMRNDDNFYCLILKQKSNV